MGEGTWRRPNLVQPLTLQQVSFPLVTDTFYSNSNYYCNPAFTGGKPERKNWGLNPHPAGSCSVPALLPVAPLRSSSVTVLTLGVPAETLPPGLFKGAQEGRCRCLEVALSGTGPRESCPAGEGWAGVSCPDLTPFCSPPGPSCRVVSPRCYSLDTQSAPASVPCLTVPPALMSLLQVHPHG